MNQPKKKKRKNLGRPGRLPRAKEEVNFKIMADAQGSREPGGVMIDDSWFVIQIDGQEEINEAAFGNSRCN